MQQSYKTIEKLAEYEFVEKHSRFIGCCKPVSSEKEAVDFINERKAEHRTAKHNVYAYSILDGNTKRYTDDGEPSGTAGMPILDIITKEQIYNICVVVTRYFGGTLLGTGGLVRAYSTATQMAIKSSNIICMQICKICNIVCSYNQYGRINNIMLDLGVIIDNTHFGDNVIIEFHIDPQIYDTFAVKIADATNGNVKINIDGEKYFSKSV